MNSAIKIVAIAALFVFLPLAAFAKDAALVVSKSSTVTAVHSTEMTKAFKNLPAKWPDGRELVLVVKALSPAEANAIGAKLLGQTPEFLSTATDKKRIVVVGSDAEVIKTVSSMPNAIGVVDIYSITGAVNVVKVDGKLPLEPGYLLHYN